jgi:hypothetical protein
MNNDTKNIIRTFVPVVVADVIAYVTKLETHVPRTTLIALLPIISTAYYAGVKVLEKKYPNLGWLLGALPVKAADPVAPTK